MKKIILSSLLLLPILASAQEPSLQNFLGNIPTFISDTLIPFLFGIAFLMLVYNAIRYFVIGGANEEGRDKAKLLAIYSTFAFVFLICLWGIVNLLTDTFFGATTSPNLCPDYTKDKEGGCTESSPARPNYIDSPTHQNQNSPIPMNGGELPA